MRAPSLSFSFCVCVGLVAAGVGCDDFLSDQRGEGEGEGEGEEGEGEEGEGEGEEGEGEEGEGEGEGEGEALGDGECRVSADCEDDQPGASCRHPDDPPQCGIGPPDIESECDANDDCDDGFVCDFINDGCGGSHDGCVAACVDDDGCADGELCKSGRCEAATCQDDGFVCPDHRACSIALRDPLSDDGDHGCDAIACADDGDCADFCVNGRCSPTPGGCALPVP